MANIGSFKKSGSEFQGEIVTLSVQTKNVRIVPYMRVQLSRASLHDGLHVWLNKSDVLRVPGH